MANLLEDLYVTGARRLRQWARAGIGRIVGSTTDTDGRYKAMMALEEGRLLMRAELNAVTKLLVDAGITTQEKLTQAFVDEMNYMEEQLRREWPEFDVDPTGASFTIKDTAAFSDRCKRERWPR